MPYYVHIEGSEPETGVSFASRADAHEVQSRQTADETGKRVITFKLSDTERHDWKRREYQKFIDGVYTLPPWIDALCRVWVPHDNFTSDAPYGDLSPVAHHFAHVAIKYPGQIAYTPTDEHGYQDRQVVIKVGKYLTQYLSAKFSPVEIAALAERVKGYTADFSLTTNPREIEAIYVNAHNSFTSCMSRKAHRYMSSVHPAQAYGDSPDLALAYTGTIEAPKARCVVWPERKKYTRIYGDSTLRHILETHGYKRRNGDTYGDLSGARIRAIPQPDHGRNVYVMPYIDAASSADLSDCGNYLVLRSSCGGEFDTQITRDSGGDTLPTGITIEDEDARGECDHCGGECDTDEAYCEDCDNDRMSCSRCGESSWDSNDFETVDDDHMCTSCASRYEHVCPVCERSTFTRHAESEYCERHKDYRECEGCNDHFPSGDLDEDDHCVDCRPDEDEDTEDETESAPLPQSCVDHTPPMLSDAFPHIGNTCLVNGNHVVTVLHLTGAIVVHENLNRVANVNTSAKYALTHVLTGLVIMYADTLAEARDKANLLTSPGVDWSFTEASAVYASNAYARYREVRDLGSNVSACLAEGSINAPAVVSL